MEEQADGGKSGENSRAGVQLGTQVRKDFERFRAPDWHCMKKDGSIVLYQLDRRVRIDPNSKSCVNIGRECRGYQEVACVCSTVCQVSIQTKPTLQAYLKH